MGEDSIENFFKNRLVVTGVSKDYIKKSDMFVQYQLCCNDNSQRCQPRSTLYNRLEHIGVRLHDKQLHGCDIFRGVKINTFVKEEIDDDDENEQIEKQKIEIQKLKEEIAKLKQDYIVLEESYLNANT